jgi:4-hydroxybenzoate polyprenyltransferase
LRATPRRLFRDSAILYGALALIVLVLGLVLGRNVVWTIALALGSFLLATSYSWWSIKRRAEAEESNR